MRGGKVSAWEMKLKNVFDAIDHELEDEYGRYYVLHPSRPKRGTTANPEDDGLFNVGSAFSVGYGSKYGPGYVVEIRLSTLQRVPKEIREKIKQTVLRQLEKKLPDAFPGRELFVSEENGILRIYGDLNLDNVPDPDSVS